eukprot:365066-Chlamydomonas_euryale.AAC.3
MPTAAPNVKAGGPGNHTERVLPPCVYMRMYDTVRCCCFVIRRWLSPGAARTYSGGFGCRPWPSRLIWLTICSSLPLPSATRPRWHACSACPNESPPLFSLCHACL